MIPISILVLAFFFKQDVPHICDLPSSKSLSMVENFPNQDRLFYNNIISSYENSILKNRDPAIILMVSDKNTKKSFKCVSRKLLKILNDAVNLCYKRIDTNSLVVDTKNLINLNSETAKSILDKDIVEIIEKSKSRIVLVDDVLNIPPESMLIFHGFGDDESNARYKGIIILLTVEIDEIFYDEEMNVKRLTAIVDKYLSQKWSNFIDYDQLRPLFARIMNNVVFVKNEIDCA
jgi:hypothetical protein